RVRMGRDRRHATAPVRSHGLTIAIGTDAERISQVIDHDRRAVHRAGEVRELTKLRVKDERVKGVPVAPELRDTAPEPLLVEETGWDLRVHPKLRRRIPERRVTDTTESSAPGDLVGVQHVLDRVTKGHVRKADDRRDPRRPLVGCLRESGY